MKKKPLTHVAIILDKSSSMQGTKDAVVQDFNEQVDQFLLNQKDGQDIRVSLITFNSDVFEHFWEQSVDSLTKCEEGDYVPCGGTSYYDALGYTVTKLLETTDQDDDNATWLIVVISDGETNSDRHYKTGTEIKKLIAPLQKKGRWTFNFLGCSEAHLDQEVEHTGFLRGNTSVMASQDFASGYDSLKLKTASVGNYFNARKSFDVDSIMYQAAVGNLYSGADRGAVSVTTSNTSNVPMGKVFSSYQPVIWKIKPEQS